MSTTIEWTDETWNPVVGCDKVSPGCDHCYAIGVAHRAMQPAHVGLTIKRAGERPDWSGVVRCLPERLDVPLSWRKPRKVFVNSMSDMFHPDVDGHFVEQVWLTMNDDDALRHTFQILTKRPRRMAETVAAIYRKWGAEDALEWEPLPNVWLGTSIESDRYSFRADHLRNTPAAVRFLSLEPLLGPLPSLDLAGIDWVIVGGESGPGARPMHPDWVRNLRDRCDAADVAFFFKQWGSHAPAVGHLDDGAKYLVVHEDGSAEDWYGYKHGATTRWDEEARTGRGDPIVRAMNKHAAGRILDGRTHDEMPDVAA